MKLTDINISSEAAWNRIVQYTIENRHFSSIRGKIYSVDVKNDTIHYSGPNRNGGLTERLEKQDFILAFDFLRKLEDINTNSISKGIPTSLYRKRSPLIGLLNSVQLLIAE